MAADQSQFKLMVFFNQSGRFNDVRGVYGIDDLLGRDIVCDEPIGIDHDVEFARFSAGYSDCRNPRQTSQPRTNDVVGDVMQAARVARV